MAEEKPKPRAPRARKKLTASEATADKTAPTRPRRATLSKAAAPPLDSAQPEDVALRAYLLWEQGEPGDATEQWLRAERELTAA
jgi:Protein of unknown function (DUF2934)